MSSMSFAIFDSANTPAVNRGASGVAGRHLVENPAKVSAADLADLAGREALAQHLRDGRPKG